MLCADAQLQLHSQNLTARAAECCAPASGIFPPLWRGRALERRKDLPASHTKRVKSREREYLISTYSVPDNASTYC
jgi:hypothetical protein